LGVLDITAWITESTTAFVGAAVSLATCPILRNKTIMSNTTNTEILRPNNNNL
jgi:hypothetical protein